MYDSQTFQVANPMGRYAIGDRDELTFNEDGSLSLYMQRESPGKDKKSNWLPSPRSGRSIPILRLYGPQQEALMGRWDPPHSSGSDGESSGCRRACCPDPGSSMNPGGHNRTTL
jgi:hypothetical protein